MTSSLPAASVWAPSRWACWDLLPEPRFCCSGGVPARSMVFPSLDRVEVVPGHRLPPGTAWTLMALASCAAVMERSSNGVEALPPGVISRIRKPGPPLFRLFYKDQSLGRYHDHRCHPLPFLAKKSGSRFPEIHPYPTPGSGPVLIPLGLWLDPSMTRPEQWPLEPMEHQIPVARERLEAPEDAPCSNPGEPVVSHDPDLTPRQVRSVQSLYRLPQPRHLIILQCLDLFLAFNPAPPWIAPSRLDPAPQAPRVIILLPATRLAALPRRLRLPVPILDPHHLRSQSPRLHPR